MKKFLFVAWFSFGLAISALAQGHVNLDNIFNTNTSYFATSGGLFFLDTGSGPVLINQDFNATFYGGVDIPSLAPLRTFLVPGNGTGDNLFGPGTFIDPSGNSVIIPSLFGNATDFAFFKIEAWLSGPSWAESYGPRNNPVIFMNPLATPPNLPPDLTGMPAIILFSIPEPSTFALLALGTVALLTFRRRK